MTQNWAVLYIVLLSNSSKPKKPKKRNLFSAQEMFKGEVVAYLSAGNEARWRSAQNWRYANHFARAQLCWTVYLSPPIFYLSYLDLWSPTPPCTVKKCLSFYLLAYFWRANFRLVYGFEKIVYSWKFLKILFEQCTELPLLLKPILVMVIDLRICFIYI